ncbi:MAG TPA: redoxin domain-containing protein, partial [Saprospiraceae bacterium]|nr:redoxin domain-containing protein [Saprospiraceae bacterium]
MIRSLLMMILLVLGTISLQAGNDPGYKIGDQATDFKLKNVDGKLVSLADYKDAKGYIIIFTCNHCPYALGVEDRFIA